MAIGTPIPRYLVARNITLFAGGAMYINSDGSISPGGDFADFHSLGVYDSFDLSYDFGLEEISSTDALLENFVQTKGTFDANVSEIQLPGGYSKLAQIGLTQSSYLGIEGVTTDPITGAAMDVSFVGIFGSLRMGIEKGKNVVTANIKPCGIFPYYAASQVNNNSAYGTGGLNSGNIRVANVVTSKKA